MPFFDPSEQQRLMQQMFTNPQGGPMPPSPQGQGGIGQDGPMIAPSFVGPGDMAQGGMPSDLGVEAPEQFNRPVPNIGDEAMMRQLPNIGDEAMVRPTPQSAYEDLLSQGSAGGVPSAEGATAAPRQMMGQDRQRLIDLLLSRKMHAF